MKIDPSKIKSGQRWKIITIQHSTAIIEVIANKGSCYPIKIIEGTDKFRQIYTWIAFDGVGWTYILLKNQEAPNEN